MDGDPKLLAEPPLLILPSLAVAVGLNEAVVLQQLHFKTRDVPGGWWRPGMPELRKEFPFWSESKIKRTLASLCAAKLVRRRQLGTDRTNHYQLDYDELQRRVGQIDAVHRVTSPSNRPGGRRQGGLVPIDGARGKAKRGERRTALDAGLRRSGA